VRLRDLSAEKKDKVIEEVDVYLKGLLAKLPNGDEVWERMNEIAAAFITNGVQPDALTDQAMEYAVLAIREENRLVALVALEAGNVQ
jgi:hypothetical protein